MNSADPRVGGVGSTTGGQYGNTTGPGGVGSGQYGSTTGPGGVGSGHHGTTTDEYGNPIGSHGSSTGHTTTGKPSMMDKLNPKKDADGDGKAGFMD
jgi:hypothetical protein